MALIMKLFLMLMLCLLILAGLYLLMIMPSFGKALKKKQLLPWLYAHRGLHDNRGDAPENSMRAFQRAVEGGFGIELDVQLSKDSIPVVFHDFTLRRICGAEGKVCDYNFEELQQFSLLGTDQKIPKFEDVLQLVDGKVPLIVELKIPRTDVSACPIAQALLDNYKGLYCIESFNPLGVRWYKKHRRDVIRGQLSDAFLREGEYRSPLHFLLENLLFNFLTRPDFVAYNKKYPRHLSCRLCRRLYHNTAAAWTIKNEEELKKARKNFDLFIFDSFVPLEGGRVLGHHS